MKISNLFNSGKTVFSFEVFPPKKTSPIESVYGKLEEISALKPDFISVTYSAGGSGSKSRTCEIATKIKRDFGVESVAHLTCINSTKADIDRNLALFKENGIENMLNAIQAGVLTNSTKSRLEKLEAQQKELEIRIAEEKIARPRLSENQVRFWLTRFRKLDPNVKSHRETLINTFVNAVYLYDEKVLITFNYKDGTKTITFDEIAAKDAPEGNGSDLGCFAPPRTPVSNGYRSFCFTCLEKGAARVDSNSCGAVAEDSVKTAQWAVFSSAACVIHPRP